MADTSRVRVIIRGVRPEIECGRFPIKRTVGEEVQVEADIFADGHDAITCVVRHRHEQDGKWEETPMVALGNDRWRTHFVVDKLGFFIYTLSAWIDHFKTWSNDLKKRVAAGQ